MKIQFTSLLKKLAKYLHNISIKRSQIIIWDLFLNSPLGEKYFFLKRCIFSSCVYSEILKNKLGG